MTCYDPDTVIESLKNRLCAVNVGPYTIEYINNSGSYLDVTDEYLAILERRGRVVDIINIESEFFYSLVESYGAEGIKEQY